MNYLPQITTEPKSREAKTLTTIINLADGGHFECCALTNSAHTFARVTPAKFFI